MAAAMRLVTLDLDGTLIERTVFQAIADHFGYGEKVREWDAEYFAGRMSLEACFRLEFSEIAGAPIEEVHAALGKATWLKGIREGGADLRDAGLDVAVLTDQPRFACQFLEQWGLTEFFCAEADVKEGKVTGEVEARFDKLANLKEHVAGRYRLDEVCHCGNGPNDVPVFEAVGWAVAVNALDESVANHADAALWGIDDLRTVAEQVLELREGHPAEA